ncbi:hypothetical protein RMCBS344292_02811 [Rhizopus microsporus]|nr:hypothetical protein RMCBS344292_02811 [Rhizopus microsporus]
MQFNVTSPESSIHNDNTPLNTLHPNDAIITLSKRKRRIGTMEKFEDTQLGLNQIISRTVTHYRRQNDDDDVDTLLSYLMHHAEQLKSFSIDLLTTEGKFREFQSLQLSIMEEYELREKAYQQRIDECEQVSRQQLELINNLVELYHDLGPKQQQQLGSSHDNHRRSFMTTSTWQSSEQDYYRSNSTRATSVNSYYGNPKCVELQQNQENNLRYKMSLLIGGIVGTGEAVHSFDNQGGIREFIIAGTGIIGSTRYSYMLHLDQNLRHQFKLLPKLLWTPDDQVEHCQLDTCFTRFSLLQRKHHCRRCGKILCHKHSLNQLPLFSSVEQKALDWHRVCDACFHELILIPIIV